MRMTGLRRFARWMRRETPGRPRVTLVPSIFELEDRALTAVVTVVTGLLAKATPDILPPVGRYLPVRITGEVSFAPPKTLPVMTFQVTDQYRLDEPSGPIILKYNKPGDYTFDFTIKLQATHSKTFTSARLYSVTIGVAEQGNGAGSTVPVIVPNVTLHPKSYRPVTHGHH